MLNSVIAMLDAKLCIPSPENEAHGSFVEAATSAQLPRATSTLAPFWSAIGAWTPELERRAEVWFETNGATSLDDIVECGLAELFLDHLQLQQVPRLKANKYFQTSMKSSRKKDSSHSPSASRSRCEQVACLSLTAVADATTVSREAEDKKQTLWLARPGTPTAGRSRSILRRGRSSGRSASTGSRVSFSDSTKGGSGCPGDASPRSKGATNKAMDQHHRQHVTPAPPSEAFGRTLLASAPPLQLARLTLPGPKQNPRIHAQTPSGPHARTQIREPPLPKQVSQAFVADGISGAPWLDWLPRASPLVRL